MVVRLKDKDIEIFPITDNDLLSFHFKINDSIVIFNIMEFHSLSEYNNYTESKKEEIFNELIGEKSLIVGYDWEVANPKGVSLRDMFQVIQELGSSYIRKNSPDIVYYEAMNPKLHLVYSRMFPAVGYFLKKTVEKSYIYMKDCKDNTELRKKNEIYEQNNKSYKKND